MQQLVLSSVDYIVLVFYFACMIGIGLWFSGRAVSLRDYTVGESGMNLWLILLSIVVTETSAVTVLSVPGKAFEGDLSFLQLPIGFIIGRILVIWLLLPGYFQGNILTAYQVLGERLGIPTRRAASAIFLLTRTIADGLRIYMAIVPLHFLTGLSIEWSILALAVTTILYTLIGGVKAVIWTDALQFVIMVGGGLLMLIGAYVLIDGGWPAIQSHAVQFNKFNVFNWGFDITRNDTIWIGLIGGAFLTLASHGADQLMVQRLLCARHQRDAATALFLSGIFVFLQFAMFLMVGIILSLYFVQHPPAQPIDKNELIAYFLGLGVLPLGSAGLILAAVLAATMSTFAGSLNASATTCTVDFYLPFQTQKPTESTTLWVTRMFTLLFGGLQMAVAWWTAYNTPKQTIVEIVLEIASFTTGIVLGLFFLGLTGRKFHPSSGVIAVATTFVLMVALRFHPMAFSTLNLNWPTFPIAGIWFGLLNSTCTFIIGWLADLFLNRQASSSAVR